MPQQPSNLKAALWMAGSIASFLAMSIAGRATTAELNVFQVLEMRSVIGFIMLLPLVYFAGGFAAMRTQAAAAASRPQRRALRRAVRLALCADADPARPS